MRKITFILTTLTVLVLLAGCCKRLLPSTTERVVVRDSIVQLLRDTTIYVEIEKEVVRNSVLTTDTSQLENKYASSTAYVSNNRLYHFLEQKKAQLPFRIKYIDKYHTTVRDSVRVERQTVEVNRLTHWQSFRLVLGNIFGALLLLAACWVVVRWWLKR